MSGPASNSERPGGDCRGCQQRDRRIAELEQRIGQLEQQVAAALRGGKRQAAPFSSGEPKADPKPPGRKPGADYGTKARRLIPSRIDEVYRASLPPCCRHCQGQVILSHVDQQYQVEIPRQAIYRRFEVEVGCCVRCHRRVQGHHPLQSSDALGAAASQLGPQAQALISHLNKELGLSYGKARRLLGFFGVELSRGGAVTVVLRAARRCGGIYQQIIQAMAQEPSLAIDATSWKVGGRGAQLHSAVGADLTAYWIDPHGTVEALQRVIPADYDGVLIHDGARVYDWFCHASHQTCLQHLLRRCREMIDTLGESAGHFPMQVQGILQAALVLRDERQRGKRGAHATAMRAAVLEGQLRALLVWPRKHPLNRQLARHLRLHLHQIFLFLKHQPLGQLWPDAQRQMIQPTSYRVEQAIRPAVVNRKVWGGNRTWRGAAAQEILMSVLLTLKQRGYETIQWLGQALCLPAGQLMLPMMRDPPLLLSDN